MVNRAVGEHLEKNHPSIAHHLPLLDEFPVSPDEHGGDPVAPRRPRVRHLNRLLLSLAVLPLRLVLEVEFVFAWKEYFTLSYRHTCTFPT